MLVKTIMNKPIVIDRDIAISKAAIILTLNNISSIIYVKNKKPVGIITKGDIVKNFGKNLNVSQIMSKKIVAVYPDDKVNTVIDLMHDHRISVILVLNEKKELVGVVSTKDVLYKACENEEFLFG